MELDLPQLTVFKYKHGDRILLTRQRKMLFVAVAFVSLILVRLLFPFGLLALIFPAMVYLAGIRTMSLGPRYMICGDHILYYANVTEINVSEAEGILRIRTGAKGKFEIERSRFLNSFWNSKQSAAQKASDFKAVTEMIVERVRHWSPEVTGNAIPGWVAPEE
jgi:hypothetical protein